MTILESFAQIPLMLYISLPLLPAALYGYLHFSKPLKAIAAAAANPADQLREKKINIGREFLSSLFLGSCIGLGLAMLVSFSWIIGDYKNSRGLFAVALPASALPPIASYVFPPAPTAAAANAVPATDSANQ
jgi:hypothetical protein